MKKLIYITISLLSLNNIIQAQCPVRAPADTTVNCGVPTTIIAGTNFVTYSVQSGACGGYIHLTNPTNAFPTPCDDCVTGQVTIGFPFTFFGNTYTTTVVQSNGIIGFGNFTYTGYSAFTIPTTGQPNNYIAGLYADIDIRCGGSITYQTIGTAPNRQFIVSYDNVQAYGCFLGGGNGSTATFQIILNEDGTFYTVIEHIDPNWSASTSGTSATQGVENEDGSIAFATPGRNSTDMNTWNLTSNECQSYVSSPCNFIGWYEDTTFITANPALTITPSSSVTYTAKWDCVGTNTICTDTTRVTIGGMPVPTNITHCENEPSQSLSVTSTCGAIQWYTADTASSPIASGNSFNPVGAAGSGIANTANAGIWTYYAACQSSPNCRTPVTYRINEGPVTTNVEICQNGPSVDLTATATCPPGDLIINQNTTFNSGSLTTSDPTWGRNSTGATCSVSGSGYHYDVFTFTVSTAGAYTFNACAPTMDAHAALYRNDFNPASPCAIPNNYITANDDGNGINCALDPRITANLVPGVTYYLVTTSFTSGTTGDYSWTYTGPSGATISQPNAGPPAVLQWYTTFAGGSPIATGSTLDPVATAGSGLTNTSVPGEYPYFVACSNTPSCRSQANFVINPSPTYTDVHVACDSFTWIDGITYTASTNAPTFTYPIVGGCDSVVILNLTIYNTPNASITGTSPICSGTTTTLTAGGIGNYQWSTGSSASTITAGVGRYELTVNMGGCVDTSIFVIDTFALPVPVVSGISTVCVGDTAILNVTGGISYAWSNGIYSDTMRTSIAGQYTVTATNQNGCSASVTTVVSNFNMPTGSIVKTDVLCYGDSTGTINVVPANGGGGYVFSWTPNVSSTATAYGLDTGVYTIVITDIHNCSVEVSTVINQPDTLTLEMEVDSVRCYGERNGTITAIVEGGVQPYIYSINEGNPSSTIPGSNSNGYSSGNGIFKYLRAGDYTVSVRDYNNCSVTLPTTVYEPDTIEIYVDPVIDSFILELGDTRIATISSNHPNATYTWTPEYGVACPTCGSTILGGYQNVEYTIVVADGPCSASTNFYVTVIPVYNVYIPNAFTPNNNGVNDYYEIYGKRETWKDVDFSVFNRWGEKVFSTRDVNFKWDGRYKGAYLNPGIYSYILNLSFIDGHILNNQGTITILR